MNSYASMDLTNVPVVRKEELLDLLNSEDAVVMNVLASHAYDKMHIKGSISAPYDRLENGEFDNIDKKKRLIIYCASYDCGASKKAAALMRERGFDAAAYEGGIKEWSEAGYPTEGKELEKGYSGC